MKSWARRAPPQRSIEGKNVTMTAIPDIPKVEVRPPCIKPWTLSPELCIQSAGGCSTRAPLDLHLRI